MEQPEMQEDAPRSFPPSAGEIALRARRGSHALLRISRGLDCLDRLVVRCVKAISRAYLDGIIAYGAAMHGVPWPIVSGATMAAPPETPDQPDLHDDLPEARFRDIDELLAWLEIQGDHVRQRQKYGTTLNANALKSINPRGEA
jgi:hypothetical protein